MKTTTDPNSFERVLLIRPGALGDAILTLPVVHGLFSLGCQKLTILGSEASWSFFQNKEGRSQTLDFMDPGWLGLFNSEASFSDAALKIIEHTTTVLAYLKDDGLQSRLASLGCKNVIQDTPPLLERRFEVARGGAKVLHASASLLEPLKKRINANDRFNILDVFSRSRLGEDFIETKAFEIDQTQPFVVLHPGSGGRWKCWPFECFVQLAGLLQDEKNLQPYFLIGPAEEELESQLLKVDQGRWQKNIVKDLSIPEVAYLLKNAEAFVGNDAGVSHLAGYLTKTLVLFGPTVPERWRPLGPLVEVVEPSEGATMADLEIAKVFTAFEQLLRAGVNN